MSYGWQTENKKIIVAKGSPKMEFERKSNRGIFEKIHEHRLDNFGTNVKKVPL
jgi:hypothetical protein